MTADTRMVILALSERAAQALEGFMLAHAADRNELVVKIGDELGDQLTRVNDEAGAATAFRNRETPVAQRVAEQMAAAGAAALSKGAT